MVERIPLVFCDRKVERNILHFADIAQKIRYLQTVASATEKRTIISWIANIHQLEIVVRIFILRKG